MPNIRRHTLVDGNLVREARPQRKARSMDSDVLRKCEADPLVIYTLARRLYSSWADRPEDREGTRVVRARCECEPGLR